MTTPKNAPMTLQLSGYLLDVLAQWMRADAQFMNLPYPESLKADIERLTLANSVASRLLEALPDCPDGDLRSAIAGRAAAYDAFSAAQSAATVSKEPPC